MTPYLRALTGDGEAVPIAARSNGAGIAVQIVLTHEEGGEDSVLRGDPASEAIRLRSEAPGKAPRGWYTGRPLAFINAPGQAVNHHRGGWHGVLAPVSGNGLFAVVDRIGSGANLEEHPFDDPPQPIMA